MDFVSDKKNTDDAPGELEKTVIRICPVCTVVNPGEPSDECQHLQLAKIDGVSTDMEKMLGEVAKTRKKYSKLKKDLTTEVKRLINEGLAVIEPRIEVRETPLSDDILQISQPYSLIHVTPPEQKKKRTITRKRQKIMHVDSRQLELIARSQPKGDA